MEEILTISKIPTDKNCIDQELSRKKGPTK